MLPASLGGDDIPLSPMQRSLSAFTVTINCVLSDPHGAFNPVGVCGAGLPLGPLWVQGYRQDPEERNRIKGTKGFSVFPQACVPLYICLSTM